MVIDTQREQTKLLLLLFLKLRNEFAGGNVSRKARYITAISRSRNYILYRLAYPLRG